MKFPTGGKPLLIERTRQARERPRAHIRAHEGSSRSGVIPEPTVIVRMEENVVLYASEDHVVLLRRTS